MHVSMEEHIFVIVNGLRVKIKMSYHIISYHIISYHIISYHTCQLLGTLKQSEHILLTSCEIFAHV